MLANLVVAGPVPAGISVPELAGVERIIRRPRAGESGQPATCPICAGTGTWVGWLRGVRAAAPCRRCRGGGAVEAVVLAKLVTTTQDDLTAFTAWATAHRLRLDRGLAVHEEGGADDGDGDEGSALVWCGLDGAPLPVRGDHLAGHAILGVAVELNGHVGGHVAVHTLDDRGRIDVRGLWDIAGKADDELELEWSDRTAWGIARSMRIRPPAAAIAAAVERARCRRCPRHAPHYAAAPIRSADRIGRHAEMLTATTS